MNEANTQADETMETAQEAHMQAGQLRDEALNAGTDMSEILTRVGDFISEEKATPEQVIKVCNPSSNVIIS